MGIEPKADKNPSVEVRHLSLPPELSPAQIQDAVAVIEDWEASQKSACELIADLYPLLVPQEIRR